MENIKVGDRVYVPEDATFTNVYGTRDSVSISIRDKEVTVDGVWFPFAIRTFYPEGGEYCEWVGLRAAGGSTPVASHEIREWEDV